MPGWSSAWAAVGMPVSSVTLRPLYRTLIEPGDGPLKQIPRYPRVMRFDHNYAWQLPLGLIGLGPRSSGIEVDGSTIRVKMGWALQMRAPISEIESAELLAEPIPLLLGIGVHGWGGQWAVNGARRPHVLITFKTPQTGRVLGFPVKIRKLHLAPLNPNSLVEALKAPI